MDNHFIENFVNRLKLEAKKDKKRIIFPEGEDLRIIEACKILIEEDLIEPILVGDPDKIQPLLNERNISVKIFDKKLKNEILINQLYNLRKEKGLTFDEAKDLILDNNYFANLLLLNDEADGIVSGSITTTSNVLKPALQIIKTKDNIKTASSFFIMIKEDKMYFFADCALNILPDSKELADIAYSTVQSSNLFNIQPKIAFLSFSTKDSAIHDNVDKIKDAIKIFSDMNPNCIFDGELQFDSAIDPSIAKLKAPNSRIKGDANILIFPDLNSGNIGYKIAQWLGNYVAIGPIVQGLNKPVNDLSRSCSVNDIVNVALITAIQAKREK